MQRGGGGKDLGYSSMGPHAPGAIGHVGLRAQSACCDGRATAARQAPLPAHLLPQARHHVGSVCDAVEGPGEDGRRGLVPRNEQRHHVVTQLLGGDVVACIT